MLKKPPVYHVSVHPYTMCPVYTAAGEKVRMRGSRRQRFDESLAGQE